MNNAASQAFYTDYAQRKGWSGVGTPEDTAYFDHLAAQAGIGEAGRSLEIGFGDGHLLDWARARGQDIEGVEIIPDMVEAARGRGHAARLGPLKPGMFPSARFDFIFVMDVFEHLTTAELLDLLGLCRDLLKPQGRLIARFPNGKSPFFGDFQFSDITHLSCLTDASLDQIAEKAGMRVTRTIIMRPYPRGLRARAKRWFAYRLRTVFEIAVGLAYYGKRTSLDPNAVVVIEPAVAHSAGPP